MDFPLPGTGERETRRISSGLLHWRGNRENPGSHFMVEHEESIGAVTRYLETNDKGARNHFLFHLLVHEPPEK
jgi:hypothetical protein